MLGMWNAVMKMKRLSIILTTVLMLLFTGVGVVGCEDINFEGCDFNPNYITVVVQTQVCLERPGWDGAQVKIEINKADGERVEFEKTVGPNQCTDVVEATFQVYKEQPVNVVVFMVSGAGGEPWDPNKWEIWKGNKQTLLWGTIDSGHDFGDTYFWNPTLSIMMNRKD
ncbi:hypothetical protein ACFLTP_09825 [Chloroflexota bacterium]